MTETKYEDNPSGLSPRALKAVEWFKETYKEQLSRISKPGQGNGVRPIDMMTAENWLCRDLLVLMYKETVEMSLSASHLSYAPGFGGDPALLSTAAAFFNQFFQPAQPVLSEHVIVGAGCSSLLSSLIHDVCEAGEGILVEVPYWGGFEMECIMRGQVNMIHVDTTGYYAAPSRGVGRLIAHYERALEAANRPVRALLLCNPHNPRGQIYSVAELEALVTFCHVHRLHLISDEIYGLSTFGSSPDARSEHRMYAPAADTFTPVMRLTLPDPSRVHSLHGISKDFGSSGLRLGFIITQANPLLRMSLAIANHAKVSTVSNLLANNLLADHDRLRTLISTNSARLREAASPIVTFLAARDIPFYPPIAGVYIWARLGFHSVKSFEDEVKLSEEFRAVGVELVAGKSCRNPQPGWFRVTFALSRPDLQLGLDRIACVLDMRDDKSGMLGVQRRATPS